MMDLLCTISADPTDISSYRNQLEAQSKETERLSRTFLGDKGFRYASTGSLLERLEIPRPSAGGATAGLDQRDGTRGGAETMDYLNLPQLVLFMFTRLSVIPNYAFRGFLDQLCP